jgi:hypothetical protein
LNLTAEEKAILKVLTYSNLSSFKAGDPATFGGALLAEAAGVLWLGLAVVVIGGVVYVIMKSKPHPSTQQILDVKDDPNRPANLSEQGRQRATLLGLPVSTAASQGTTTTGAGY